VVDRLKCMHSFTSISREASLSPTYILKGGHFKDVTSEHHSAKAKTMIVVYNFIAQLSTISLSHPSPPPHKQVYNDSLPHAHQPQPAQPCSRSRSSPGQFSENITPSVHPIPFQPILPNPAMPKIYIQRTSEKISLSKA
jgi:hypothetical protein